MRTTAKITDWDGAGWIGIECDGDIYDAIYNKHAKEVEVEIIDGRSISADQRRKIFALVSDITDFASGSLKQRDYIETLRAMKLLYIHDRTDSELIRRALTLNYCNLADKDIFSLSDVDMTTAKDFIDFLVELCVNYSIPTVDTLLNLCEDTEKYIYSCIEKRKCCICGKKADIHEVEKVGMGGNRVQMHHLGQAVMPLCRRHHSEAEHIGQTRFDNKYKTTFVRLDEKLCRAIGWRI